MVVGMAVKVVLKYVSKTAAGVVLLAGLWTAYAHPVETAAPPDAGCEAMDEIAQHIMASLAQGASAGEVMQGIATRAAPVSQKLLQAFVTAEMLMHSQQAPEAGTEQFSSACAMYQPQFMHTMNNTCERVNQVIAASVRLRDAGSIPAQQVQAMVLKGMQEGVAQSADAERQRLLLPVVQAVTFDAIDEVYAHSDQTEDQLTAAFDRQCRLAAAD
jgi:hypothetical protein